MIDMAHKYGVYVIVDGAQATPHMKIDVADLDCDFYVFSGHKLFAPTGIGAVYGKQHLLERMLPWQVGGGMIEKVTFDQSTYADSPYIFEAGTGSIASVYGLGAAIDYLNAIGMDNIKFYEQGLLRYATHQLTQIPKLHIVGNPHERAGVLPFIIDGIENDKIGEYLNDYGIALRVGHHCAQPALDFFGLKSMARPSIAFYNSTQDIDSLVSTLQKLVGES
jgi:cysteine desulfurase/selenocysteine lyase